MELMLLQSMRVNRNLTGIEVTGSHYQDKNGIRGWHLRCWEEPRNAIKDVWVVDGNYPEGLTALERNAVEASIKLWETTPILAHNWSWINGQL